MRRWLVRAIPLTLVAALLVVLPASSTLTRAQALQFKDLNKIQQRILSGFASTELTQPVGAAAPAARTQAARRASPADNYFPSSTRACASHFGDNVKVNQNCLTLTDADLAGRSQANNETSIAQDPLHPSRIVASDNNYFRGDGSCGGHYSLTRGDAWNDNNARWASPGATL